ncbi:hypothetical protein NTHI1209_00142 [Haemophilus influenzae]|uniref:Uncharacterized protein n=1 Tax=Haemophilus influenzae TaxID=727 RepID=A0A158T0S6_HAEIF|nr:hypothetical protein NTHI1209_00142 [Haemophilus influenzae]
MGLSPPFFEMIGGLKPTLRFSFSQSASCI